MKFILIFIFLIKLSDATCQADLISSSSSTPNTPTLEAYDLSGKPIPTGANAAIEGSAMLNEQFVKGVVKFKNGQQYKDVLLNLSLTTGELYFKKDSATLKFLYPVDEFALGENNKKDGKIIYFKSGFPRAGANTEETLYQVLAGGSKACLLKYVYKTAQEHYEYGGAQKKEYVLREKYYVYNVVNNIMSETNLNSNSIKKSLPDYIRYIDRYILNNKVNLKKEENVKLLIDFINEQPQG